jgi:hypothetical protein
LIEWKLTGNLAGTGALLRSLARQRLTQAGGGPPVWLEEGLRAALHRDGCHLLEELLQDPDLVMESHESLPGEKCHPDRTKEVEFILGNVCLNRSYFYRPAAGDQARGQGRFPLDERLMAGLKFLLRGALGRRPPEAVAPKGLLQTRALGPHSIAG